MKFTINVDCTPDEARAFMGLPDVKPFQEEMMAALRDKMLDNFKMMEPDKMMQMWGSVMNQGMSMNHGMGQGMANMHDFFSKVMTNAASTMTRGTPTGTKKKS